MFAVIVNTLAIVAGSLLGLLLRRGMPERLTSALMQGLGLCTVVIGVQGAVQESNVLIMIVSVVTGVFIGEGLDADGHVNRFTEGLMSRFAGNGRKAGSGSAGRNVCEGGKGADKKGNKGSADKNCSADRNGSETDRIANAFVTSCLIMNVGAMVIVGSLDAGLRADYTMLYTKSLLDFISGIMLTAAMGIGVMGSAMFTLLFQGAIVLMAELIAPFVSDYVIQEMACTGCLIILALGLNMLELTKIKVINYLPALAAVPLVAYIFQLLEN